MRLDFCGLAVCPRACRYDDGVPGPVVILPGQVDEVTTLMAGVENAQILLYMLPVAHHDINHIIGTDYRNQYVSSL